MWDMTVFTENGERLLRGKVAERLLLAVVEQAHTRRLLSEEHFIVEGILIQGPRWLEVTIAELNQALAGSGTWRN